MKAASSRVVSPRQHKPVGSSRDVAASMIRRFAQGILAHVHRRTEPNFSGCARRVAEFRARRSSSVGWVSVAAAGSVSAHAKSARDPTLAAGRVRMSVLGYAGLMSRHCPSVVPALTQPTRRCWRARSLPPAGSARASSGQKCTRPTNIGVRANAPGVVALSLPNLFSQYS